MTEKSSWPLVSVVITTKNEAKHIENCLLSIQEQTHPNIETIVIDNFSTDSTKTIALKYTDKVYEKGHERSAQRNYGMLETAQGEYVMFLDADMILAPTLIEHCVKCMEHGDWLALHIPEIVLGKSYWSSVRRFERRFYDGTVIDGARFFFKRIFVQIGGFDETMSGPEDWDIDKKIKQFGRIGLLATSPDDSYHIEDWKLTDFIEEHGVNPSLYGSVIYHNEAEFNLRRYIAKKEYYAKSFDMYIRKWGKNDVDITKQLGLWYRFVGVFIEHGKWKKLVKHPILTFGMMNLRLMVGMAYLRKQ